MLILMGKKIFLIYAIKVCLSKSVNTYLVDIFILWVKHDFHLALCIRIQLCIGID